VDRFEPTFEENVPSSTCATEPSRGGNVDCWLWSSLECLCSGMWHYVARYIYWFDLGEKPVR
jgi:hypothetical protein